VNASQVKSSRGRACEEVEEYNAEGPHVDRLAQRHVARNAHLLHRLDDLPYIVGLGGRDGERGGGARGGE
jgi:hypothetical protein